MNYTRIGKKTTVGAALLAAWGVAQAAPFNSFDPRSMAMGGAGVAVGNAGTASLFNPALLAATHEGDKFALELPIVGARVYDPDDFVDAVDDFQESTVVEDLDTAIDSFNASSGNTTTVQTALTDLDEELLKLGGKPLQGEVGVGMVLGVPSRNIGMAFTASGTASFGGVVNYEDSATLGALNEDLSTWDACGGGAGCLGEEFTYIDNDPLSSTFGEITFTAEGDDSDLVSSVDVQGLIIQEFGISLAREFQMGGHDFAIGVTPKYVKATVLDYTARVEDAEDDDFDGDDYTYDHTHFNFDIGIAKDYANGWRTGLVIKNVISQEYDTYNRDSSGEMVKTGNTIETDAQARLGISRQAELYTLAADLDLTENDPVGYEGESRYLALGAEFNAWDWAQLRAGYRANLSDSDRNVWSAGLGLSPFGAHFDLAVSGSDDELGAALQLGFRF